MISLPNTFRSPRVLPLVMMVLAIVIVISAIVAGAAISLSGSSDSPPAQPLGKTNLSAPVRLTPSQVAQDAVLSVSGLSVSVVDTKSGQELADVTPGGSFIWATLRPSANQLLVSDVLDDGTSRLLTYDLSTGENLSTNPLANRAVSTFGFDQRFVLNDTGSLLFYLARADRCPTGGDAAYCDVHSIGIVDVEKGTTIRSAELPTNCGYAQIVPSEGDSVVVTCRNIARLVRVASDATVTAIASFDFPSLVPDRNGAASANAVIGDTLGAASYMVFDDGTVKWDNGNTTDILSDASMRFHSLATYVPAVGPGGPRLWDEPGRRSQGNCSG